MNPTPGSRPITGSTNGKRPLEVEKRKRYTCDACGAGGAHPAHWPAPRCHQCDAGVMREVTP